MRLSISALPHAPSEPTEWMGDGDHWGFALVLGSLFCDNGGALSLEMDGRTSDLDSVTIKELFALVHDIVACCDAQTGTVDLHVVEQGQDDLYSFRFAGNSCDLHYVENLGGATIDERFPWRSLLSDLANIFSVLFSVLKETDVDPDDRDQFREFRKVPALIGRILLGNPGV